MNKQNVNVHLFTDSNFRSALSAPLLLNEMLQKTCKQGTYRARCCFTSQLSSGLSSISHALYGVTVHDLHICELNITEMV